MRKVYSVSFFLVVLPAFFVAASLPAFAGCTWSGRYNTNFGSMSLNQSGSSVNGSYKYKNGKISGSVSGNDLKGSWTQQGGSGWFRFTMDSSCNGFHGAWGYSQGTTMGGWGGDRAR